MLVFWSSSSSSIKGNRNSSRVSRAPQHVANEMMFGEAVQKLEKEQHQIQGQEHQKRSRKKQDIQQHNKQQHTKSTSAAIIA